MDLERAPPSFERQFDLIVGLRYLHRPLFQCFGAWLEPGGSIVYETFTTVHRARYGKPTRVTHVLQPAARSTARIASPSSSPPARTVTC
ncbi:MAG: hypothetical protein KAY37_14250 [Phycisphaerae bacterium]|nr:hypothetical protein [Phycisphaerae bacterium]